MFGMVIVLLVTFGPLAIGLLLLGVAPNAIVWYQVQCLLYLQFSSPAFEPFVFAITLPKLRKSARETFVGRQLAWMVGKVGVFTQTVWSVGKTNTTQINSVAPQQPIIGK